MEEQAKVGLLKNRSRIIIIVGARHSNTILNFHVQPAFAEGLLRTWYCSQCLTLFLVTTL